MLRNVLARFIGQRNRSEIGFSGPEQDQIGAKRMLLKEKVAIVTGGSGLLGSAICERMAAEGARVIVNYYRREKEASRVVNRINGYGGEALALQADIRDREQVVAMVNVAVKQYGPVDVLVNNASTVPTEVGMKSFLEHTWADYQRYIDTVLMGAFHCCLAVLPDMVKRKNGRIINIGTTALNEINGHLNPYVTAKGGLLGMTRSLAEEFGRYNITVNQVVPGWMWQDPDTDPPQDQGRVFRDRSPLGKGLASPLDVAGAVVFLASDLANMITGAYIPVCAGQVMPG